MTKFTFFGWGLLPSFIIAVLIGLCHCAPPVSDQTTAALKSVPNPEPETAEPDESLTFTQIQLNRKGNLYNSVSLTRKAWPGEWPQTQTDIGSGTQGKKPQIGFHQHPSANQRTMTDLVKNPHGIISLSTPEGGIVFQPAPAQNVLCPGFPFCGSSSGSPFCPGFPFCGGNPFCAGFPFCKATASDYSKSKRNIPVARSLVSEQQQQNHHQHAPSQKVSKTIDKSLSPSSASLSASERNAQLDNADPSANLILNR